MIAAERHERRTRASVAGVAGVSLAALFFCACASHRIAADDTLPSRIAQARALAAAARPPKASAGQSLETWDPLLAAALADLARSPSAATHRQVAIEYRRLRVLDTADAHFTQAIGLDPGDAGAYDGRARLWRDFGFPTLGLGDAYRAASAAAVNTLGTVFEAMGRLGDARGQYDKARQLDPAASFPITNLCHIDTMLGRREAVAWCVRAVTRSPTSAGAHNNLALAYAVAGNFPGAQDEFSAGGDAATAAYNMGVVYMAARQFNRATGAFRAAREAEPGFALAGARLKQIDALQPQ